MILNTSVETMSPSVKSMFQSQKLQKLIEHAYKYTSFYQKRMKSKGLTPTDIQCIQDIGNLPFMSAADLSASNSLGLLTIQDISEQVEMIARSLVACNITKNSVLMILAMTFTSTPLLLQRAAESLGATVISAHLSDVKSQIKMIMDFGVTTLFALPGSLLQIADSIKEQGLSSHNLSLSKLICERRHCPADLREELAAKYQLPIYTVYGRDDIMNVGIAGECHQQFGLHIHEDHFYPEIINPRTGILVAPNQPGELVLTSLSRKTMPLIRYRTREFAILAPERCSCGRTSARLIFLT